MGKQTNSERETKQTKNRKLAPKPTAGQPMCADHGPYNPPTPLPGSLVPDTKKPFGLKVWPQ